MARFCGKVGYSVQEEIRPGVWADEAIREVTYYGDVKSVRVRRSNADKVADDVETTDEIGIIADEYAYENFSHIKYVEYYGIKWCVTSVEVQRPRINLTLGGPYHG